ncbi:MAG: S1/P1 nuclease [Legionellales bacterium]|nr:S1/P1 nuclease [Legionellales bacterium]
MVTFLKYCLVHFKLWLRPLFLIALLSSPSFGWNALGHRLVAEIAYHHLTPQAKRECLQSEQSLNAIYKPQSWADAAVWLDTLRYQDVHWFDSVHYIDIPFSEDGSALPPIQEINALWAIDNAMKTLLSPYAKRFDKGVALRVLAHVVGDLHQPLHAASRVSAVYPKGDRGGNFVTLHGIRIAKNLHAYWDKGGGFLLSKHRLSSRELDRKSQEIEQRWPCRLTDSKSNPDLWAAESHDLALNTVYKRLPRDHRPNNAYQKLSQTVTAKQLALAGCRLAGLLNQIIPR